MKKKVSIVPRSMWLPLFFTLSCNALAYYGTRLVTNQRYHFNLSNSLDDKIPFLPWTVIIYFGCYIFWVVNYILGCRQEQKKAFQFMGADLIAKLVCLICFIVFPTTNVRPVIEGNSLWNQVMLYLYQIDAADNLFPSIHCLTSWFCFIAVRENKKISIWYKVFSLIFAVAVCISTLTTRLHVLIDAIAGVALAEGSYFLVAKSGFSAWYQVHILKWNNKLGKWRTERE